MINPPKLGGHMLDKLNNKEEENCGMRKKIIALSIVLIIVTFMLTGCIPGNGKYREERPAGFLWGIWHGWIAPFSLVFGLIDKNIRVYEVYNTGWWYDFGFYMAIISGFGGISLTRKSKKKKS